MAGGVGTYRDDHANLVLNEDVADYLAERIVQRFHTVSQKLKGGTLNGGPQGAPGPNPLTANQWGGKAIIKHDPTMDEITAGIRQEATLLVWQSPDGLPHYVTVDVGRLAGGLGGPGADDGFNSGTTRQAIGGGTFPLGNVDNDPTKAPLSYRASAMVLLGTPGTMQDPFYIDINRGQRFTALASYVAVTAQMNAPPVNATPWQGNGRPSVGPNGVDYVSGSMAVYATLGIGTTPTLAPVLYTQYIDMNTTGEGGAPRLNFSRIVPPRANVLTPISGSAARTLTFNFVDNAGKVVGADMYQVDALNTPGYTIEVPQDAFKLNVSPGSFSDVFSCRLVYQLSV